MEEYPNNSHKYKKEMAEKPEKKKVEKVVTSPVRKKKKSEMSKIMEMFLPEDVTNVKDYVIMDVAIPTIKDAIIRVVEMMLGVDSRDSRKRVSGAPRISYWGRFDDRDRRDRRDYRDRTSDHRSTYDAEEYVITSRAEAEDVLSQMDDMIRQYRVVSIGDYNELLGVRGNYTDNKYGWSSLRSADIVRVRDGWVIKLPKAMPIDD